jgi:hypothetical protein
MMNQVKLPSSPTVPVNFLSASFNHVTNSYKFYWLLAILDQLRETQSPVIEIDQLVARLVAGVWYPTNFFLLSFGKQDRLSDVALLLKEQQGLNRDAKCKEVTNAVLREVSNKSTFARQIASLARYVPYRFLRPFFAQQLRGQPDWKIDNMITELADQLFHDQNVLPLYRFVGEKGQTLEIHPTWFEYLQTHMKIVLGFCLWHLLNYLQKNNPNVPNIAGKLFEPEQRDLSNCRKFWRQAFDQLDKIKCIYSGVEMDKSAFSLDHFLPWSFVTHDLMWNIIPTTKSVNSAKSDCLPDWSLYFEPFARQQFTAFQAVASANKNKLLEDYILLFNKSSIQEIKAMPFADFRNALNDSLAPQIQIAKNMGFVPNWKLVS